MILIQYQYILINFGDIYVCKEHHMHEALRQSVYSALYFM